MENVKINIELSFRSNTGKIDKQKLVENVSTVIQESYRNGKLIPENHAIWAGYSTYLSENKKTVIQNKISK